MGTDGWLMMWITVLNALMANSKITLQLSSHKGFEVKVLAALHMGKLVIASCMRGILLQIQHRKSGYLCKVGDNDMVVCHLYDLYTDKVLYKQMNEFTHTHICNEAGTDGKTAEWLYLVVMSSWGHKMK